MGIKPVVVARPRRKVRRLGATIDPELLERLRDMGKALGYVDPNTGKGQLASPIVEDLLRYAVSAYDAGDLVLVAETTRGRLKPDGRNV